VHEEVGEVIVETLLPVLRRLAAFTHLGRTGFASWTGPALPRFPDFE
jgi:hypothetical protein